MAIEAGSAVGGVTMSRRVSGGGAIRGVSSRAAPSAKRRDGGGNGKDEEQPLASSGDGAAVGVTATLFWLLARVLNLDSRVSDVMQAVAGIFTQATTQQADDAIGKRRRKCSPVRLALEDGGHDVGRRLPGKGPPAGKHLIEHASERPDVGTSVDGQPAHLLR